MVTNEDFENDYRTKRVSFGPWKYGNGLVQNIDACVSTRIVTINRKVTVMNGIKVDIVTRRLY